MVLEERLPHVGVGEGPHVEPGVRCGEHAPQLGHELLARISLPPPLDLTAHLTCRRVAHLVERRPREAVHGGELRTPRQVDPVLGGAVEGPVPRDLCHGTP